MALKHKVTSAQSLRLSNLHPQGILTRSSSQSGRGKVRENRERRQLGQLEHGIMNFIAYETDCELASRPRYSPSPRIKQDLYKDEIPSYAYNQLRGLTEKQPLSNNRVFKSLLGNRHSTFMLLSTLIRRRAFAAWSGMYRQDGFTGKLLPQVTLQFECETVSLLS